MDKPAILTGQQYEEFFSIIQPTLPSLDDIKDKVKDILQTRMITNYKYVREFEQKFQELTKVKNIVALQSCTAALMLAIKAMKLQGEIILPSFTFFASGHALLWNDIKPVPVDCSLDTFTISPDSIQEAITSKTSAILGVHVFGNPCDIKTLEEICSDHKLRLLFDSAHGAGSIYKGQRIGNFGDAECFSMSPTKVMTACEGGILTTPHKEVAELVKYGRDYGNPGTYDSVLLGLNSRMPEFNAIIALESLRNLIGNVENRQKLVARYRDLLVKIPGITFQRIEEGCLSSCKDFSIVIDPDQFNLTRDELFLALEKDGIMAKKYFDPPLHTQILYKEFASTEPDFYQNTNFLSERIISLPIWSHMTEEIVSKICAKIQGIHNYSSEIREKLRAK